MHRRARAAARGDRWWQSDRMSGLLMIWLRRRELCACVEFNHSLVRVRVQIGKGEIDELSVFSLLLNHTWIQISHGGTDKFGGRPICQRHKTDQTKNLGLNLTRFRNRYTSIVHVHCYGNIINLYHQLCACSSRRCYIVIMRDIDCPGSDWNSD